MNSTTVAISLAWSESAAVDTGLGGVLLMPKTQALPGLYRVHIGEASGTTWIYIDEAADLSRAMQALGRPVSPTSSAARLATRIADAIRDDGMVSVAFATNVEFDVDGQSANVDLSRPEDRRLAQNAAIVAARFDGADRILTVTDE